MNLWGRRAWRMRSFLAGQLVLAMLLTFAVVGAAILAVRVPVIERESRVALQAELERLVVRLELMLASAQDQLTMLDALVIAAPSGLAQAVFDHGLQATQGFDAAYQVSADGVVLAAGLTAAERRAARQGWIGRDVSGDPLFLRARRAAGVHWSGRYTSLRSGQAVVGVAMADPSGGVLIAEVSAATLLHALQAAAGQRMPAVQVFDHDGERVAGTEGMAPPAARGLARLLEMVWLGTPDPAGVTARSAALDWAFVGHPLQGPANPRVQLLLAYIGLSFASCLLVGVLVAPLWSLLLTRPLQRIVEQAGRTMHGVAVDARWPRGLVAEFNQLSRDLERLAQGLREREQKFQTIFNASPVPMSVTDVAAGYRLVDVNEAWCRELRRPRAQVLGRTTVELGIWTGSQRLQALSIARGERMASEVSMVRGDGQRIEVQIYAQRLVLATEDLMLWAVVDLGPMRAVQQELRLLNQQLEERVAQRTDALDAANAELAATVEQLRTAQDHLVRSGKLAALGELVAGVAHELNSPLGNAVMAVSAMEDAVRRFRKAMVNGLKRADLTQLLDAVTQGTDIAQRNLRRAADLVASFKQVAVDRTSAQRRRFELGEVVHEMVVSLQPSFAQKDHRVEVDVPMRGLQLDSYPGALGQVLGNLVQNALLHGLQGRASGTVRLSGGRDGEGDASCIWLRVADDGHGIAPEHLERIFEPFMTTRADQGGTGLGLHISQSAVVELLGGSLTVHSAPGQGSVFEIRLPPEAPRGSATNAV
jgi:signal transduction histidine kinase